MERIRRKSLWHTRRSLLGINELCIVYFASRQELPVFWHWWIHWVFSSGGLRERRQKSAGELRKKMKKKLKELILLKVAKAIGNWRKSGMWGRRRRRGEADFTHHLLVERRLFVFGAQLQHCQTDTTNSRGTHPEYVHVGDGWVMRDSDEFWCVSARVQSKYSVSANAADWNQKWI